MGSGGLRGVGVSFLHLTSMRIHFGRYDRVFDDKVDQDDVYQQACKYVQHECIVMPLVYVSPSYPAFLQQVC